MAEPRDYWLSLAVYDEFRGVPVRKAVARGYLDLRGMPRDRQIVFIRLGSLFFQGRSWRRIVGDTAAAPAAQLTAEERTELESFRVLRREIGAAVIRLLDEEETLDPFVRDATLERLETMGFLDS
jgi:hypothetical protein